MKTYKQNKRHNETLKKKRLNDLRFIITLFNKEGIDFSGMIKDTNKLRIRGIFKAIKDKTIRDKRRKNLKKVL